MGGLGNPTAEKVIGLVWVCYSIYWGLGALREQVVTGFEGKEWMFCLPYLHRAQGGR